MTQRMMARLDAVESGLHTEKIGHKEDVDLLNGGGEPCPSGGKPAEAEGHADGCSCSGCKWECGMKCPNLLVFEDEYRGYRKYMVR